MATTSTIPTVKAGLVTAFSSALATASTSGGQIPVDYAWPGPDTAPECVFFGPHPQTADIRIDIDQDIPTIKAGRKQRQEDYTLRTTVWVFRPDLTAAGAQTVETRAFTIGGLVEDVLADDPQGGIAAVQVIAVDTIISTLFPFEKGWACELGIDLNVRARLT